MEEDQKIEFKPKKRKQLRQRIKEEDSDEDNIEEIGYINFYLNIINIRNKIIFLTTTCLQIIFEFL